MKVVVACGGTGGHAFPGIAVAIEMRRRGHDVTVWDSGRDVESRVMRLWDGPVFTTLARPLKLGNLFGIARSYLRCRRRIREDRPDVLLAMGSYSSLPPVLAAHRAGVKIVLHEANTVPGRAVEMLSRFAAMVATSFDSTAGYLKGVRTVRTGLPVRPGIASGRRFDSIPPDALVVLVTGGSQGAHRVNCLASEAIVEFDALWRRSGEAAKRPLYVIHQTGARDEGGVMATYLGAGIPARVSAFENHMADAFASADIVIARAGASTCFELAACGKSALFLPLPSAVRNHQHFNAEAFVRAGAADEADQEKLSSHQLARYLFSRCKNEQALAGKNAKMRAMSVDDAAARVADAVEKAAAADGPFVK